MFKWEQTTDRGCQSSANVPLSKSPNGQTLRAPFHVTDPDASSVMNVVVRAAVYDVFRIISCSIWPFPPDGVQLTSGAPPTGLPGIFRRLIATSCF